jgi:hypothetical protein
MISVSIPAPSRKKKSSLFAARPDYYLAWFEPVVTLGQTGKLFLGFAMESTMLNTVSTAASTINTAANAAKLFKELLKGKKGDILVLLEEIKENSRICWMVVERDTDPMKAIPALQTPEYDRLLREGFDLNQLNKKRKKIEVSENILTRDQKSYLGKSTAELVTSIYDSIKDLKSYYRVDPQNQRINWRLRILNLHKKIMLLIFHFKGY